MKKYIPILCLAVIAITAYAIPITIGFPGQAIPPGGTLVGGQNSSDATKFLSLQIDPNNNAALVEVLNTPAVSIGGGPVGAANFSNAQVVVSNSAATIVVPANATQRSAVLRNTDATITMYVGGSSVTSATGMPLKAGESIAIDTTAAIYCRAASGSPVAAYIQVND